MKKFRKLIVALLAMTMVIGCLTMQASAATNVTLYFELPDGWTADTTGVNIWGGATATGSGNTVNKPASWGSGTLPQVTDAGTGLVSVVIDDTSKVEGIQFVSTDNGAYNKGDTDNLWNAQINSQNVTAAYFSTKGSTANSWYKEASYATPILPPTLDDIYFVTGAEGLTGANWGATPATGLMTDAGNGTFTITFTGVDAGTYEYKILQDPADFGWDNAYTDSSAGQTTQGNGSVTVDDDGSSVKFTINATTKLITVLITPPGVTIVDPSTAAPTTAAPTTAAPTTAGNNTTTAEPTSANNGGQGGDNSNDSSTGRTVVVVIAGVALMLAATVAMVASKKKVTE